ncbi:MerR family transcriptional regulator [Tengunoibacter tsumagoiensis]|uniref:MerR family transcriptional regulator n=1 Tax=Tengunoibacter tsumagoiensis TaxID=2014871 RepID=A0A401ZXM1_9CHLR|nr:MerR family transcriptional regulator [Tengunoibacter tsumagoiensis]GCE11608.1 MerR family transcriptional regulator [Tengunoibacter tsumagoiensis]
MTELTISEVARQAGVRASAIRYYESVGLLPAPRRVSGQRRYQADILRRLAFIQTAQAVGFSITEMQTLLRELDGDIPLSTRWQSLAQQKLAEVESLIHQAQTMKQMLENGLHCHCSDLEQCINCVIKLHCKERIANRKELLRVFNE